MPYFSLSLVCNCSTFKSPSNFICSISLWYWWNF